MFTASSSRASSARAAVVERLRRVLFSPSRLLSAGTLACVFVCGGFAAAQEHNYVLTHKPTAEDANAMYPLDDGVEIPVYYKEYKAGEVAWDDQNQITVEGLFYSAKTGDDGKIELKAAEDLTDEERENKQAYQLVYSLKGQAPADFRELLTESGYKNLQEDDKAKYEAYYVAYEIDPVTGLRKLYSETDVQAGAVATPVEHFNDATYLSSVVYNAEVAGQSIAKDGAGNATISGEAHNVKNIATSGGILEFSGTVALSGDAVVERANDYGDQPGLQFNNNVDLKEGATLTNKNGFVSFGADVAIGGSYISQNVDARLSEASFTASVVDSFGGVTTVTGKLVVADAGFKKNLVLKSGSETVLYRETLFGGQELRIDENGKVVLTHGVIVEEGATLYAGAGNLDNATVRIDGEARFIDVNDKDDNGNYAVDLDVKDADGKLVVTPVANDAYQEENQRATVVTVDENGVPTSLLLDNTYVAMVNAVKETEKSGDWKDSVNSSSFTGGGTVNIEALFDPNANSATPDADDGNYLDNHFQTGFFTIFNGDKSEFKGDTNVKFGTLVLAGSSYADAQNYEAKKQSYAEAKDASNQALVDYLEAVLESSYYDPSEDPAVQAAAAAWNEKEKKAYDEGNNLSHVLSQVKQEYGSTESGVFTVYGKAKASETSNGSNGRLVLWRDSLNGELAQNDDAYGHSLETAPILNAKTIDFQGYAEQDGKQSHEDGSRLGAQIVFNTTFKFQNAELAEKSKEELLNLGLVNDGDYLTDVRSDRTLATLNADEIVFSESNYLWYDGISRLDAGDDGAALTISLNAPTIKVNTEDAENRFGDGATLVAETDVDGNVVGRRYLVSEEKTDALQDLFAKPLVQASVGVTTETSTAPDSGDTIENFKGYDVKLNSIDVADFAENRGMSQEEQELAQQFDQARPYEKNREFFEALYNEDDADKVAQTIHNVSLLGHSMLNMHSHFGNPSSPFFGGAALSAASKRGQGAKQELPTPDPEPSAIEEEEEEEYNPTRGVWASYTHTSSEGDNYLTGSRRMPGYDLQRSGIIGGVKRQYDATLSAGLFFGLTAPEIESVAKINGGFHGNKMEMTDFQFAGHLEKIIEDNWELCLFVGGGMQEMDWERNVALGDQMFNYQASGSGNTLTGTAYLAYRVDLGDHWTIRPTIGVDSEHSWLYGFQEDGVAGAMLPGYELSQIFTQTYAYDQTYYNRNLARVGFSVGYDGAQGWAGLNARAFYSTQLGGKPSPLMSFRTVGAGEDALEFTFNDMSTHVMGSDAFSVGGGGYLHLNKAKTLTADADVNASWYKNATTLNVTGGVSYRF